MHASCEIILPEGTEDIESAVASVMGPFCECPEEDDDNDYTSKYAFWDWFVIGGRFAGNKLLARYDQSKIQRFYDWLKAEGVTVSGLQCGKQELSPASQIEKVDAKWNEMFPSGDGVMVACPMFRHSNDQYARNGKGTIEGDICRVGDCLEAKTSRVIIAGPSYVHETDRDTGARTGPLEAVYMIQDDIWNGVTWLKTNWDRSIGAAVDAFREHTKRRKNPIQVTDESIAVTVDYHS